MENIPHCHLSGSTHVLQRRQTSPNGMKIKEERERVRKEGRGREGERERKGEGGREREKGREREGGRERKGGRGRERERERKEGRNVFYF